MLFVNSDYFMSKICQKWDFILLYLSEIFYNYLTNDDCITQTALYLVIWVKLCLMYIQMIFSFYLVKYSKNGYLHKVEVNKDKNTKFLHLFEIWINSMS